ncbi:MAG TPA: hypothetical protein VIL72_04530, partial [Beijerinckiaceae bacterium]
FGVPAIAIYVGLAKEEHLLATRPTVPGEVLEASFVRGGTQAWISFTRIDKDGREVACRTQVTISRHYVQVGDVVAVVPRPDSCGQPAVGVRR